LALSQHNLLQSIAIPASGTPDNTVTGHRISIQMEMEMKHGRVIYDEPVSWMKYWLS
jgi:hypothetical protein